MSTTAEASAPTAAPTGGQLEIQASVEHGVIKLRVRPELAITWTEIVLPMDVFFATVGESLHRVMAKTVQLRTGLARTQS